MSMQFDNPVNDAALAKIKELFGEPVASDRKTLLFDRMRDIRQHEMKEVANLAKQPATVEIHGQGTIKTMSDGTRYEVTPQGWRKLDAV